MKAAGLTEDKFDDDREYEASADFLAEPKVEDAGLKAASARRRLYILITSLAALIALSGFYLGVIRYDLFAARRRPAVSVVVKGTESSTLKNPMAIALTGDKFYVTDTKNARVVVFLDDGTPLFDFKGGTLHDARGSRLVYPNGIAINSDKEVYVTDIVSGKIIVFNESGRAMRLFEMKPGRKMAIKPLAIAFDKDDNLYIAEAKTRSVYIYDNRGKFQRTIGGGKLNFPNGLAISGSGDIYVADTNSQQVVVYTKFGIIRRVIRRPVDNSSFLPRGLAFDRRGNLIVADVIRSQIVVFNRAGKEIDKWGKLGKAIDELSFPNGIAYRRGVLFIVDRANNRVLLVRNFP